MDNGRPPRIDPPGVVLQPLLVVEGAREHNLKNVTVSLPRGRLVVLTGPSGSGKSSLAFDTIYAEGQRRYVESLSAYARQFLEQLRKPDVDRIEGLSPAIAIEQRPLSKSPRSTVGTVTEIADYLRLLYARVGKPHCPNCGKPIEAATVQQIVDRISATDAGAKVVLLAPICRGRKGELKLELERLRRDGFVRVRIDGQLLDLGDDLVPERSRAHDLDVVVDRVVVRDGLRGRITDSVELALKLGEGRMLVSTNDQEPVWMSERFACIDCGISLPPIEPRLFSFNGPHGACPSCDGLGARDVIDPERVVENPKATLREGAITAWGARGSVALATELSKAVAQLGVLPDVAWKDLPMAQREALLFGSKETKGKAKGFVGAVQKLEARLSNSPDTGGDSDDPDASLGAIADDEISRFVIHRECEDCRGTRLRPEALAVRLLGKNIGEVLSLPLDGLAEFITALRDHAKGEAPTDVRERTIAEPIVKAVAARLGFLIDVGLDYLSLQRSASTLSSGEGQRIRLATQIGAALVGVLYVLDEPSIGLHARDHRRLIEAQLRLRDLGNTVIVVEHDREAILAADYVVDMGPAAGANGGYVVATGTPSELMANEASVTGPWLSGARSLAIPKKRTAPGRLKLRVVGARLHNLRNVTVEIPTGLLTCVTGVSGSGKSSLVTGTLLPAVRARLFGASAKVGECDDVTGIDAIDKVVSIDQAPIGRTPRSNPATYTGIFSLLRELYAGLPESRARGYKGGRFSFNVKGGRCEACQGDGVLRVEMHFLPDVFVTCDTCEGRRYNRETLEVQFRGMSIADTLLLTVERALPLFEAIPRIRERLEALHRVGLGYIALGQAATTLSGGEAQRVKLARELARRATGKTLYVLDEPTTGLHFADIEVLLHALLGLRDQGNTVLVIEHNLDVVACADWVIDMGPEGGWRGGNVVACGTPEAIVATKGSFTGEYLRPVLDRR